MYESLIFDLDGTLWDTTDLVAEGYNIQLRREGLAHLCVTGDDLKKLFGRTMDALADAMLASIPVPERYRLMDRCVASEEAYLEQDPCQVFYPGVLETLQTLSRRYRLFIVTNAQSGYPALCTGKLGATDLFSGWLTFGDTGLSKGGTIRELMRRHNISNAIYIGDTQLDQQAAQEAGIPFLWAGYGFGTVQQYEARADSFPELVRLL